MNKTLLGFFRKEIRQTLRDYRMRVVLFLAPVFQLTLFGVALSNEVRNVQLAAVYAPTDRLTRQIYEHSIASGWFVPAQVSGNDVSEWLRSGRADAVLISSGKDLASQVARGEGNLQLLINSQNVIKAQSIENYMKAIAAEVLQRSGERALGVQMDVRTLYNASMETSVYMVPGVMSMLVCIVTVLLTSMGLARERESGTFETLLAAPVRRWEIVLGKTLPYMFLGMCQIPLILLVAVSLFAVPIRGPLFFVFAAALFFVATTVSIGLMISTIAQNQQQAMLGGFLFLFPAILLSGLMFPIESMPLPMRGLAQINPLTHFIGLLRNILLKGGNPDYFVFHCGVLCALSVFCILFALSRFRKTLA